MMFGKPLTRLKKPLWWVQQPQIMFMKPTNVDVLLNRIAHNEVRDLFGNIRIS